MTTLQLLNGHKMPVMGFGTYMVVSEAGIAAVKAALECGYRHIDTAHQYNSEREIGVALKDCISRGVVKREDVFLTSKLWMTKLRPDLVRGACEETLSNLGCDYIDLYLIHWPTGLKESEELVPKDADGNLIFSNVDYVDTWKAMEDLVDSGLARSIGVSNFSRRQIQRVWDNSRIKPSVLQVEVHPYWPNLKLIEFAKSLGMQVTAYGSLGSPAWNMFPRPDAAAPLDDPVVAKIATRTGKSPGQVLIRYGIDRGLNVIPKSIQPERIKENFDVFDFQLTAEDMAELNNRPIHTRIFNLEEHFKNHPHYPFNEEY